MKNLILITLATAITVNSFPNNSFKTSDRQIPARVLPAHVGKVTMCLGFNSRYGCIGFSVVYEPSSRTSSFFRNESKAQFPEKLYGEIVDGKIVLKLPDNIISIKVENNVKLPGWFNTSFGIKNSFIKSGVYTNLNGQAIIALKKKVKGSFEQAELLCTDCKE